MKISGSNQNFPRFDQLTVSRLCDGQRALRVEPLRKKASKQRRHMLYEQDGQGES